MLKSFFTFVLLSLLMASASYAARPFIIDTDVGTDDEIAMLYLLSRQDVDVKAITIEASGETHCEPGLKNVTGLLQATKKTALPIACGRAKPLAGNRVFPDWIRKNADTLVGEARVNPDKKIETKLSALELLKETLQHSKEPVDIVAIAPLTNLAELVTTYPALKKKIRMIYVMGGAVKAAGNIKLLDAASKNEWAEWNIYIDPVAADRVFRSGVPITLVPLDATNEAPVTKAFYARLKQHPSSLIYQLFHGNEDEIQKKLWYFWDVLTAGVAVDESLVNIKDYKLRVVLHPEEKVGATVIDEKHGNRVRVCTRVRNMKSLEDALVKL